jgi:HK97 family phage prohead protease
MTQREENMSMELKHKVINFETKMDDANDDSGIFEGYGSVFGNIDLGGDIVEGGAFQKSLAEWSNKGQLPQMLGFHRNGNVIGDWLEMREDDRGLYVRGRLWSGGSNALEESKKAYNMLKGTGPKGLSIGYVVKEYETEEFSGGIVTRLKEVELFEVSVVGYAMNPQASVERVKSMIDDDGKLLSKRDVEKVLRDAKLSRRQAKAFIAGGYEALIADDEGGVEIEDRDDSLDLKDVSASLTKILSTTKR